MGIAENIVGSINGLGKPAHIILDEPYTLIECGSQFYVNLVLLGAQISPADLIDLQEKYREEGKILVHLWEDVWQFNEAGVLSRIGSFLSLNQRYHARKARLIEVDARQASAFFNTFHLQGFVKAKYYYGLTIFDELVSLAAFSDLRNMKAKGADYTSAELVRFASKKGATITGGLSKLIKHFLTIKKPNDLMSYADRDWSLGKGYERLGFELTAITPPADLYVEQYTGIRYFPHRLPKKVLSAFDDQKELNLDDYLAENGFLKAFNTGNLKYHLYI